MRTPSGWEITRRGGVRRAGVAQTREEHLSDRQGVGSSQGSPSTTARPRSYFYRGPNDLTPWSGWLFEWAKPLGLPTCPYVIRWQVGTPWCSLRLHHWLASDDPRAPHDHPWWFATLVVRGGYRDVAPGRPDDHLRAPTWRVRPAEHRHTVVPDPGGAWTVMITGRKTRRWGFWHGGRFHKANRWFARYGHHPCD